MAAFKDGGMPSVREREVKGLKKGGDLLGGGAGGMFSYMSGWNGTCGCRLSTFTHIMKLILRF